MLYTTVILYVGQWTRSPEWISTKYELDQCHHTWTMRACLTLIFVFNVLLYNNLQVHWPKFIDAMRTSYENVLSMNGKYRAITKEKLYVYVTISTISKTFVRYIIYPSWTILIFTVYVLFILHDEFISQVHWKRKLYSIEVWYKSRRLRAYSTYDVCT